MKHGIYFILCERTKQLNIPKISQEAAQSQFFMSNLSQWKQTCNYFIYIVAQNIQLFKSK